MRIKIGLTIFILLLFKLSFGQKGKYPLDSAYDKFKNGRYFLVKGQKNKYENQGMNHSAYYYLNPDSSFVYYSVFEVGYKMTFGNWTNFQNKIIMIWDSIRTFNATRDTSIYKKYYKYSKPTPFKIVEKKFVLTDSCLIPVDLLK